MSESQSSHLDGMFCSRLLPATLPRLLSFKPLHFWSRRGQQPPSWFSHSPLGSLQRDPQERKARASHFTAGSRRLPACTLEISSPTRRALWALPLPRHPSHSDLWLNLSRGLPHPFPEDQTSVLSEPGSTASALVPFGGQMISVVGAATWAL